jgi:EpsI family protein
VYYWFVVGGAPMLNEYLAKLKQLVNTATISRSDGGLVRLVTPIGTSSLAEASRRIESFIGELPALLDGSLP